METYPGNLVFVKTGILWNFCHKISTNRSLFPSVVLLATSYTFNKCEVLTILTFKSVYFVVFDISLHGFVKKSDGV